MALNSSEICRILFESDNESGDSGSEIEDNILAYSGTDSYEPSSEEECISEEDTQTSKRRKRNEPNKKRTCPIGAVGLCNSIEEVISTLNVEGDRPTQSTASSSQGSQETIQEVAGDIEQDTPSTSTGESTRTVQTVKGKNGFRWTKIPQSQSTRTAVRDIVHRGQQPKGEGKNVTNPLEAFSLFFSDSLFKKIVEHTNSEIELKQQRYKNLQFSIAQTNKTEIKALIGILIFSALHKDNHLATQVMFDSSKSGRIYKAAFSEKRFRFLIDCLRFDNKSTRAERRETDKFAPIREVWEEFENVCKDYYEPGPYITIDEQLLAFRGRCPFKMYIPNKPAKYGIKFILVCDVGSKYMIRAEPYIGKGSTPAGIQVAEYYVKKLTEPVHGSNRNITMDNWFMSVPLAIDLLKPPYNLTVLGTLRLDKREIPQCMINKKGRPVGDTQYLFNGNTTLLSQKVKNNKVVCLLSTMHKANAISNTSGKPVMIEHYNETKYGVDTFDQMCSTMSCSRKTKRWPLCVFYGMINMATINSFVVLNRAQCARGNPGIKRSVFMEQLHDQLLTPWLEERLKVPTLRRTVKLDILSVLKEDERVPATPHVEKKRTTCKFCPSKKRRMTQNYCLQCNQAFCMEHRAEVCQQCAEDF